MGCSAPAVWRQRGRARHRRIGRWALRISIGLVTVYALGAVGLYLLQPWLVFPGSFTQGTGGAEVTPSAGEATVTLRSAGGRQIVALYGQALRRDGEPAEAAACPTVIYFYGNNECISRTQWMSEYLRREGLNVLIPEYPGYGLSGGKATEQSFFETADAAHEYLTRERGVAPQSVIVAGRSIGSGPAVYLASSKPVGGLITFSAFTRLSDVAARLVKVYPATWLLRPRFDNESRMREVRCPILIVHGTADGLVPPRMAVLLERAAAGRVQRVDVEGGGHNDLFLVGGADLRVRVGRFARGEGRDQ